MEPLARDIFYWPFADAIGREGVGARAKQLRALTMEGHLHRL
jgi:hypothetical protein